MSRPHLHSPSPATARGAFDSELYPDLHFLPLNARDSRYVQAALLRAEGMRWKDVATQVGLSQGRCQNLTGEPWWAELSAWAGRQAWGGDVLVAAVSRVLRCLRHLPPESQVGLAYTRMALLANGLLEPGSLSPRRDSEVNVQVGILHRVEQLSDAELNEMLEAGRTTHT